MVIGIEKFREYFAGHEDKYAIIGGAACDLLFDAAGLPFRATKDIDLVLCVEVVDATCGERFAAFLDAGGYQARERSEGGREYFRFRKPTDEAFPFMIELFARKPNVIDIPDGDLYARIPVDEAAVSLSAILLDDDYFQALQSATRLVEDVTILGETLLIPFKARAFLDLSGRLADGEKIDKKNIKKHRNDVFRLIQLLPGDAAVELPPSIRGDLRRFIDAIEQDDGFDPKSFEVKMSREEGVSTLRSVYRLTSS